MPTENGGRYKYVECPWENNGRIEILWRPILCVYLHNPEYPKEHPFPVYGLVDSGADICLFPGWIGETLRHKLKHGRRKRRILGVTGTYVNAYLHTTYIEVPEFKSCRCDCWFSEDYTGGKAGAGLTYGLLGQNDFFLHYRVSFDRQNRVFSLSI